MDISKYKGYIFDLDGTITPAVDFMHRFRTIGNTWKVLRGKLPYKEGVVEFIQNLRSQGKKVALASNANPMIMKYFYKNKTMNDIAHLETLFDVIITSDMVKNKKPAPDLYLRAMEQLELKPSECLAFEDSLRGATSAKSAGLDICIIESALLSKKERDKAKAMGTYYLTKYST